MKTKSLRKGEFVHRQELTGPAGLPLPFAVHLA